MAAESSPTAVFYGSAKAERSRTPGALRRAMDKWLERIGTKNVEKHFIEAHERVLTTLTNDQRKEVFAKEINTWKKAGKRWGIAATVIDAALATVGIGITVYGLRHPREAFAFAPEATTVMLGKIPFLKKFATVPGNVLLNVSHRLNISDSQGDINWKRLDKAGRVVSLLPSLGSLAILATGGPGHWLAHLAAGEKEQLGKMKARSHNYVDSGKAAEHAKAVGKAVGDVAKSTAKYITEHPDEIRKTIETANRVSWQKAESKQKIAQAKQKAADAALEAEYQDWIAHHPDKAYYENSGIPYPSKAEYVEIKKQKEAEHKARLQAEKRALAQ